MEHDLKILPEYFNAVADGSKPFEIRRNDRDFKAGDTLLLREGMMAEDAFDPPRCPCYNDTGHCPECIFGSNTAACPDLRGYNQAMEAYRAQTKDCWVYTGRELRCKITYVLPGGAFGIAKDYCVLGIALITEGG